MDLTRVKWRKARKSGNNGGNCVEIGTTTDSPTVMIRDTKSRERGHLTVNRNAFRRFLRDHADDENVLQLQHTETPGTPPVSWGFLVTRGNPDANRMIIPKETTS